MFGGVLYRVSYVWCGEMFDVVLYRVSYAWLG